MKFKYVASQSNGKVVEGEFDGQGPAEVLEYLSSKGLRPVSLKTVKGIESVERGFLGSGINISDKIFLTKYLALMLKVGTDLFKAIDILMSDLEKPAMKSLLSEVRGTLEKGQPFYTTFLKYPKYFSSVFVNLIKAGESSGNLEIVFNDLSNSLQRDQELRRNIKSALTYPMILLVGSVGILILLVSFALPKIATIFTDSVNQIPPFSKVVFAVGLFLNKFIWLFLIVLVFLVVFGWYFFFKTLSGRKIAERFAYKVPVISKVLKHIALQRFATTLSSLLKSGLPILDSLEITADAVGSEELRASLMRVSREGIAKGLTIGDAFRREEAFPRVVANLIAISEKAGHTEDILETLASFYESEIESSIKTLVRFLEPALLLGIGLIIGVIALAILVPIYQLVGQF